jgi:hypothetical protein
MRHASYSWSKAYLSAALETDFTKLYARIEEALAAIDKRLYRTAKLTDAEFDELQRSLHSLHEMCSERPTRKPGIRR